jgi:lipopolysaccharide export system permease protein
MRKFDWYILKELAGPFIFGVMAFASILIGSSLLFKLANYLLELDMPIRLAGKIFLLELPGIVVLTFPMSTLLATLLAFGRLSGNSEIIAFRASGLSFVRLMVPVILLGLLTSGLTIYINEKVVPYSAFQTRKLVWEFSNKALLPSTQKYLSMTTVDHQTGLPDYLLYAEGFDSETNTLSKVYFQDFEGEQLHTIVEAKEARWMKDKWVFIDGKYYYFPTENQPVVTGTFSEYSIKSMNRTPKQIVLSSKNEEEMSAFELSELIKVYIQEGQEVAKLLVKFHQRFAIPLSCLVFAILGAPLGVQPNRSGSFMGFGLSIIGILVYYVVLTMAGAIGQAGYISPILGAWLPNLLFTILGVGFAYKASYR